MTRKWKFCEICGSFVIESLTCFKCRETREHTLKLGSEKQKRKRVATHDAEKPVASTSLTKSIHANQIEKTKKCPIDVWWDWENAGVPYDLLPEEVYKKFVKKLQAEGFIGRVKIWAIVAYKDSMPTKIRDALYEGVEDKKNLRIKHVHNFNRPENSANDQVADHEIEDRVRKWLKKGRKPQNTMLVTGDNGFRGLLRELLEAGHTILLAFRKIESQIVTSREVLKFACVSWNWRVFLSLRKEGINKKLRSAQFEERKRQEAAERKRQEAAELGRERLLQRIIDSNMFEWEVSGDGNCQFRALANQLYGSSEMHEEVRRQVVHQLEDNRSMYENYVQDYDQYCMNMARLGEWGDHVTLQAAADRFVVDIHLLTSFENNGFIEIVPRDEAPRRSLWLSYWSEGEHYNSLYDD